jgi:hypothetical protein
LDTIITFGDGKLERLRLEKGNLVVEPFNREGDYPTKVNVYGVGTKKE